MDFWTKHLGSYEEAIRVAENGGVYAVYTNNRSRLNLRIIALPTEEAYAGFIQYEKPILDKCEPAWNQYSLVYIDGRWLVDPLCLANSNSEICKTCKRFVHFHWEISGYYFKCENCGENRFLRTCKSCVPLGMGNGFIHTIARLFGNERIVRTEDARVYLVDQCDKCHGSQTEWILTRIWYNVEKALEERQFSEEQIDVALTHPHDAVRLACVIYQRLSEAQIEKALKDDHFSVVEAAKKKRLEIQA